MTRQMTPSWKTSAAVNRPRNRHHIECHRTARMPSSRGFQIHAAVSPTQKGTKRRLGNPTVTAESGRNENRKPPSATSTIATPFPTKIPINSRPTLIGGKEIESRTLAPGGELPVRPVGLRRYLAPNGLSNTDSHRYQAVSRVAADVRRLLNGCEIPGKNEPRHPGCYDKQSRRDCGLQPKSRRAAPPSGP